MPKITRKQQKVFAVNASNNGVFGSLQANDPTYSQDPDLIQGRPAYSNGWNDATYSAEQLPPLEEFQALQYLFSRQLAYIYQEGIPEWDINTTYYKGSLVKSIQNDGSFILYVSLIDENLGNQVTYTTKWQIETTSTTFLEGIPLWRSNIIYKEGSLVKVNITGGCQLYISKTSNNSQPYSDTNNWILIMDSTESYSNVSLSNLSPSGEQRVFKTGMIIPFGGSTAPSGWLKCDGSEVSRTTYSNLFSVIGTTYGAGDGSTTFNIPNASSIVTGVNTNVPCKGNGEPLGVFKSQPYGSTVEMETLQRNTSNTYIGAIGISGGTKIGVHTDATKSGIVGTVTRSVFTVKFIIKY